jgi:hypothetical protein
MNFEIHCHSYYSKGEKITWECLDSPKDVVRICKKKGMDGLALTDHKVISGWKEAEREAKKLGMIFIPAQEIHTKDGHIIGLGINEGIKNNQSLEETLDQIRRQGGLSVAPHPFDIKGDGIRDGIRKVDVVEIFNSINLDKLSNKLAEIKAKRFGKPGVVGSDAHSLGMIARSVNISKADDLDSFLKEIRRGRVEFEKSYIPLKVIMEWVRDRLEKSYFDVLNYMNSNYIKPKAFVGKVLLNRYLKSRSIVWDALAHTGLSLSKIYSAFMFLGYY